MTTTTSDDLPKLPEPPSGPAPRMGRYGPEPLIVHFFATVTIPAPHTSRLCLYGDEVVITPSMQALSVDRNGGSWLDILDDPEEQVRRYGKVRCARGPWPSNVPRVEPGSLEEADAIEAAWSNAHAEADDEARAAKLAAVRAKYGRPPLGNKTTANYGEKQ